MKPMYTSETYAGIFPLDNVYTFVYTQIDGGVAYDVRNDPEMG